MDVEDVVEVVDVGGTVQNKKLWMQYEVLAWLAALAGDRTTALDMLKKAEVSPTIAMYPR